MTPLAFLSIEVNIEAGMEENRERLARARAGFIMQGTTLRGWCQANGVDPGYAHKALSGVNCGPAAIVLRERICVAARLSA
jgi:hypothetical protein